MVKKAESHTSSNPFTPEIYRDAAREHVPVALDLYYDKHYVLATYLAGLAVESIFRAFITLKDRHFDARHDLMALFKKSGFSDLFPPDMASQYAAQAGLLFLCWSNNHRYRSEKALRSYWKNAQLDRMDRKLSQGDFLKELTRRSVDTAIFLVTIGVEKWPG